MEIYRNRLLGWYHAFHRPLPWRLNHDPYRIWVSEIILQQTRVQQGTDYYLRFMERFPNVAALAAAPEQDVLRMWQGLGYYSRARNMHHTARVIMEQYAGIFPSEYNEILKLKGVGTYTAAAIASVAFNIPVAAVDGNVCRVLSRFFGIDKPIDTPAGKNEITAFAGQFLDPTHPGDFNQAVMELGALCCIPSQPGCASCPLQEGCSAFLQGTIKQLPVKSKRITIKNRYLHFIYIHNNEEFYLVKRAASDIWGNLFQFPLIETLATTDPKEVIQGTEWQRLLGGLNPVIESVTPEKLHLLTHQRLHIRFYDCRLEKLPAQGEFVTANFQHIDHFPLPKPIENFLASLIR